MTDEDRERLTNTLSVVTEVLMTTVFRLAAQRMQAYGLEVRVTKLEGGEVPDNPESAMREMVSQGAMIYDEYRELDAILEDGDSMAAQKQRFINETLKTLGVAKS